MQVQKKWLAAVVLLTFMLTALLPQAVLAEPETWDAVLADYPDHAVNDFSMGLGTTCRLTWAAVVSQLGADKPVRAGGGAPARWCTRIPGSDR